jgi:hypothetical protein
VQEDRRRQIAAARCVVHVERALGRRNVLRVDSAEAEGAASEAGGEREDERFHASRLGMPWILLAGCSRRNATRQARDELVAFLDRRAFEPILHLVPADLDFEEQRTLEHVKVEVLHTMRRYHDEGISAEAVRSRFMADLRAERERRGSPALAHLELPRLPEIEREFLHLCDQLGVRSSSS